MTKTSWQQITVDEYLKVSAIIDDPDRDELSRQVALLAVVTGKDEAEILDTPASTVAALMPSIAFLAEEPVAGHARPVYTIDGIKFAADLNPRHITTAQYIDFQGYARDIGRNLKALLSVFLIPVGHAYGEGYDLAAVQGTIGHLPVTDALGIAFFFVGLYRRSMLSSLRYSLRTLRREAKREPDPARRAEMELAMMEIRAEIEHMRGSRSWMSSRRSPASTGNGSTPSVPSRPSPTRPTPAKR